MDVMTLRTYRWLCGGMAAMAVAGMGIALWCVLKHRLIIDPSTAPPLYFDGNSDRLQQTIIVPTLDSPIPDGKSAIWCVSFQLAWNRLKEDFQGANPAGGGARTLNNWQNHRRSVLYQEAKWTSRRRYDNFRGMSAYSLLFNYFV